MSAQFLDGTAVAAAVLEQIASQVVQLKQQGITPGLGTILVGDDGPSTSYVNKKHQTCQQVGIASYQRTLPASATQAELLAVIDEFNADADIDGYILQLPLPPGFDFTEALARMSPDKDADGLHPTNLGRLVLQEAGPRPCTPAGILAMLAHYQIPVAGREVVVVGRGPTLGRPLALMMTLKDPHADAAVTVIHSGVKNLADYTRRADILVSATGRPSIITPDMVKSGAVVVSGGISWEGKKLLPDVDESVAEVASWITPRLGGVGPTTVAMLLKNTVDAALRRAR
ncbi:MAG: tetrahydrofolate dehydrogenase/cyclohydrolase catalytic domain-containing protein [Halopseudomonas sp.]